MKKRILLTFTVLFTALTGALADGYGLTIAGVEVTDANKADLTAAINASGNGTATGTIAYDSNTKTLSLNAATITTSTQNFAIQTLDNLTISTTGNCTVEGGAFQAIVLGNDDANSVDLTFTGSGTLTLTKGIYINNASAEHNFVLDNTSLVVQGNISNSGWYKLTVNKSNLTVSGNMCVNGDWGLITLTDATISAPSGAALDETNTAIVVGSDYANGVTIVATTSTGIQHVDAAVKADAPVFDLQGRRVQNPKAGGLYIVNGRKVMVQ